MRHRRVRAAAGRDDLEDVVGAHQRACAERDLPGRQLRPVVHAVDGLHREAVEQSFLHHHAAAAFVFLGGLEDEIRGAVEAAALRHRFRCAEQHRRVAVVAARVHLARHLRLVRDAGRLVDVQRIEVGTQPDGVTGASLPQDTDDAGAGDARVHVESERTELVGHVRSGRLLLERGLRMRVEVMAPAAHFGVEGGDFGDEVQGDDAKESTNDSPLRAIARGPERAPHPI